MYSIVLYVIIFFLSIWHCLMIAVKSRNMIQYNKAIQYNITNTAMIDVSYSLSMYHNGISYVKIHWLWFYQLNSSPRFQC
jgi:hypothetical protein